MSNEELFKRSVQYCYTAGLWKGRFYGLMTLLVGTVVYYEVRLHKEKESKSE